MGFGHPRDISSQTSKEKGNSKKHQKCQKLLPNKQLFFFSKKLKRNTNTNTRTTATVPSSGHHRVAWIWATVVSRVELYNALTSNIALLPL